MRAVDINSRRALAIQYLPRLDITTPLAGVPMGVRSAPGARFKFMRQSASP